MRSKIIRKKIKYINIRNIVFWSFVLFFMLFIVPGIKKTITDYKLTREDLENIRTEKDISLRSVDAIISENEKNRRLINIFNNSDLKEIKIFADGFVLKELDKTLGNSVFDEKDFETLVDKE